MKVRKQLMLYVSVIIMTALAGCSSSSNDEPNSTSALYRSLIKEFKEPEILQYNRRDFNIEFIHDYNDKIYGFDDRYKIVGVRVTDFKVQPIGEDINHEFLPYKFNALLEKIGDVNAPAKLPVDAWDYQPLTKNITSIDIEATCNQLPDIVKGEDCSRYFDISYVSWNDYIKNGYSWEGIENPGPVYRLPLQEFNKMGEKKLVDANKIRFHISNVVTDNYLSTWVGDDFRYKVTINFDDGKFISKSFMVVNHYILFEILNYISTYNLPKF